MLPSPTLSLDLNEFPGEFGASSGEIRDDFNHTIQHHQHQQHHPQISTQSSYLTHSSQPGSGRRVVKERQLKISDQFTQSKLNLNTNKSSNQSGSVSGVGTGDMVSTRTGRRRGRPSTKGNVIKIVTQQTNTPEPVNTRTRANNKVPDCRDSVTSVNR